MPYRCLCFLVLILCFFEAYSQRDVDLHLNGTFLSGKNILKVKRDYHDPYLWVLAANNEVFRINSVTRVVDDYTSKFSAYGGSPFIDIAARSQDSVYIATNSTNVIEYNNGSIKLIGSANGVKGIVNSIAYEPSEGAKNFYFKDYTGKVLSIATDHGYCHYECDKGTMLDLDNSGNPARIFESSYRTEVGSYLFNAYIFDTSPAKQYPILGNVYKPSIQLPTPFVSYIYYKGSFGNNIYSVFTTGTPYEGREYADPAFTSDLWATEKGLFVNNRDFSYYTNDSSGYKHYLDNIRINKITSIFGLVAFGSAYIYPLTKENILVGTDQGLYFSDSGYYSYRSTYNYTFFHFDELGNKIINDINVNAVIGSSPICEDGIWVATNDGLYLIKPDYGAYINNSQQINAAMFDGQAATVTQMLLCNNGSLKAEVNALAYNGNVYQWYKDGTSITNEINSTLTITAAGDYYAVLYDPCTGVHVETNHLKVTSASNPVFTFDYPDNLYDCAGSVVTLQTETNANYLYRWYKDGVLNGNNTAILNTTQPGKYKLEIGACADNWVSTKEVSINFITTPQPVITANKPIYCFGDQATLSVSFVNDGTYTLNWLNNGVIVNTNQNKNSLTTTQAGNYTVSITSNLATCSQTSASYALNFNALPTISLERSILTTFCSGQTVDLKATYTGGSIKWSTGETSDKITVKQAGNFTATVLSAAGCEISQSTAVNFVPNPVLNLPDAALCQFTNQTITLTAPPNFTTYTWNGKPGSSTYTTNILGKVNLTVTDINGCSASQIININSHCDDIHLPNTFTPNGDGINDTWAIEGLEGDASTIIKVYNRYGASVFQSVGYTTPWDGTFSGKKLPAGVYYYVISARKSNQVISGSVTIIY